MSVEILRELYIDKLSGPTQRIHTVTDSDGTKLLCVEWFGRANDYTEKAREIRNIYEDETDKNIKQVSPKNSSFDKKTSENQVIQYFECV